MSSIIAFVEEHAVAVAVFFAFVTIGLFAVFFVFGLSKRVNFSFTFNFLPRLVRADAPKRVTPPKAIDSAS